MAKNRRIKKSRKNKIKASKSNALSWYYFIPLLFIVGIVPLIVFAKVLTIEGQELLHWKGSETAVDFFSYYKSVLFSVFSFISFLLLAGLALTKQFKFKKTKYYIPLGIYIGGVVLSFIFSKYDTVAYRGFVEQFQGVWVMVGYGLVIISIYNFIDEEKQVKLLSYGFIFSAVMICIIGLGQYFGADLFKTTFGKKLILPQSLHHIVDSLNFTFGKNTIYATLYNTNFVGSFAALLLPFALSLFLYFKEIRYRILSGVFLVLMIFTWLGSNSRAGYLGFAVSFIFIIILYRKKFKIDFKKVAIFLGILFLALAIMNNVSDGRVKRQFSKLNIFEELERLEQIKEKNIRFEELTIVDKDITVATNRESLNIKLADDDNLNFYNENNEMIPIIQEDNKISFEDEKYKNYSLVLDKKRFDLKVYGKDIKIYLDSGGFKILGMGNVLTQTEDPPRIKALDGMEKFASSRGYIWSRSIPMLKDNIITGHGPDTFPMEFPQDDYAGKLNSFSTYRTIVDKPHNMYLQIGINTGVLSLLGLLALYIMYFVDSMRIYFKKDLTTYIDYVGVGAFTGIIGYLAAGMFNDQIISVAPLFYAMVGLGLAINRLNQGNSHIL